MLSIDAGIGPKDLGKAMLDRDLWKTVVQSIPPLEPKDADDASIDMEIYYSIIGAFIWSIVIGSTLMRSKTYPR